MNEGRHRVVIVGCGFDDLFAARALRRADVDVTVIARNNHHLFQPLLRQTGTGRGSAQMRRSSSQSASAKGGTPNVISC